MRSGDGRDDEGEVDRPHDHGVDGAPPVPGDDAEQAADDDGDERGGQPDQQRHARPADQLAQDVVADVVGAEEMVTARLEEGPPRPLTGLVRGNGRPEDGQ